MGYQKCEDYLLQNDSFKHSSVCYFHKIKGRLSNIHLVKVCIAGEWDLSYTKFIFGVSQYVSVLDLKWFVFFNCLFI